MTAPPNITRHWKREIMSGEQWVDRDRRKHYG
jgi:hypothetical protein